MFKTVRFTQSALSLTLSLILRDRIQELKFSLAFCLRRIRNSNSLLQAQSQENALIFCLILCFKKDMIFGMDGLRREFYSHRRSLYSKVCSKYSIALTQLRLSANTSLRRIILFNT